MKPDALIICRSGSVYILRREICPEIDIHVSTQANNTNYMTYRFWYAAGGKAGGIGQGTVPGGNPGDP